MLSQPVAPHSDDDKSEEPSRAEQSRQKDNSLQSDGSIESDVQALRTFRERLKQSTHRPKWWSDQEASFAELRSSL
jgi:hypothetical protein